MPIAVLQRHLPHDEWLLVKGPGTQGPPDNCGSDHLTLLVEVWPHIYSLHSMLCISYEISLISSSMSLSHAV